MINNPIANITTLIQQSHLSDSDIQQFNAAARLNNSPPIIRQFHSNIRAILEDFQQVAFTHYGFFPFEAKDIAQFICDDDQFGFEFNKKRQQGTLYGQRHTQIRRKLINETSNKLTIPLITRKLASLGINTIQPPILKIEDLGMGQAVYHIESEHQNIVIKQTQCAQYQPFYCQLLRHLNWPSYHSITLQRQAIWEITDYLGHQNLMDMLRDHPSISVSLIDQLAQHAALADLLGRGDRHVENYVIQNNTLFPVDISHLFWENNEVWIQKYCRAGLYEINADPNQAPRFLTTYQHTIKWLHSQLSIIKDQIRQFFPNQSEAYIDFVSARLTPEYYTRQSQLYQDALIENQNRQPYRKWLNLIAEHDPKYLHDHELLLMYYLANQNRQAAFFLLEDRPEPILEQIKTWARTHGFDSESA